MVSRKNCWNRSTRKNRRSMRGGMAPVNDTSMNLSRNDSYAQGSQYLNIHKGQYGGAVGAYPSSVMASTLPTSMVASARTGPLDTAIASIQGMQDGGRRMKHKHHTRKHKGGRKHGKKHSKKASRKHGKKHSKKASRKSHRGGSLTGSPLKADSMLLPSGMEKQAALNYEWSMAKDPSAFAPKQ